MLSAESWYPMQSRKLTYRMVVESNGMSIKKSEIRGNLIQPMSFVAIRVFGCFWDL